MTTINTLRSVVIAAILALYEMLQTRYHPPNHRAGGEKP
jgi:cell division protein ZapA (FtsZ GTPase activity inhibitor)